MSELIRVQHGRVSLALHALGAGSRSSTASRAGDGRALLCLHALRGRAADWQHHAAAWPGPVYALDFSGHGDSAWLRGGAYSPELLAGDADAALARLGEACLAGAGLGAYVALLVAGARPGQVPGALLLAGPGLAGAGAEPDPQRAPDAGWRRALDAIRTPLAERPGSDPLLALLETDFRPPDYAEAFAARAQRLLLLEGSEALPPWWEAIAKSGRAERSAGTLAEALARLAG